MVTGFQYRRLLYLVLIASSLPFSVLGHTTGLSTADLRFGTNQLEAELTMATADLIAVVAHVENSQPLDADHNGQITGDEFTAGFEHFKTLMQGALVVEFEGQPVAASAPRFALDEKENFHVWLSFPRERPKRLLVRATLLRRLPPKHIQFISVHDLDGKSLGNRMLNANENSLEVLLPTEGMPSQPKEPRVNTFGGFLLLGVKHIWTGYDHILFLLALLLVCVTFRSAIEVVTCFTVAHSLTLALATLNLVSVSSRVVEPAIAGSIIYVGAENLLKPEGPKGRWRITFLFGLVHGLGFATVLRDMGVASSTTGVTVPLVAFNLGVEVGQIVIACVLLPLIWKLRNWPPFPKHGVRVCSAVVAAAGCYWLVQRIWFN